MNMLLLRNYFEKLMKARDHLLPQNEGFVEFAWIFGLGTSIKKVFLQWSIVAYAYNSSSVEAEAKLA